MLNKSLADPDVLKILSARSRPTEWTDSEHSEFIKAVRLHGRDWTKIAEMVSTRNYQGVKKYSVTVVKKIEADPNIEGADLIEVLRARTKPKWTELEEKIFAEGVAQYGRSWNEIADMIGTKSYK